MPRSLSSFVFALLVNPILVAPACLAPAGTAIAGTAEPRSTLQIKLERNGTPVRGALDLRVTRYATASGGTALAVQALPGTVFHDGLATVYLPEPAASHAGGWVEIAVAAPGSGVHQTLQPRLELRPVPVAVAAAGFAPGSITAASINPFAIQRRIGTCSSGTDRMRLVMANGSAVCVADQTGVTEVIGTNGIEVAAAGALRTVSLPPGAGQRRIGTACPAGSWVESVGVGGSVVCREDSRLQNASVVLRSGSCSFDGNGPAGSGCTVEVLCPEQQRVPLAAGYTNSCLGGNVYRIEPVERPQGLGFSASVAIMPGGFICGGATGTLSLSVTCISR